MKDKKLRIITKAYTLLSKALFTCATSGLGLALGGPIAAFAGILIGVVGGDILEQATANLIKF